jgi:glucokinase
MRSENLHSGFRLQVLNDFVAVGYAIPTLSESDLLIINEGERVEGGPVAVMGPGTGLGECQLMWDSGTARDTVNVT